MKARSRGTSNVESWLVGLGSDQSGPRGFAWLVRMRTRSDLPCSLFPVPCSLFPVPPRSLFPECRRMRATMLLFSLLAIPAVAVAQAPAAAHDPAAVRKAIDARNAEWTTAANKGDLKGIVEDLRRNRDDHPARGRADDGRSQYREGLRRADRRGSQEPEVQDRCRSTSTATTPTSSASPPMTRPGRTASW